MKKAIQKGLVWVNDQEASTATFIRSGDSVVLHENSDDQKPVFKLKLEVRYEDEHIAAVNKPAGYAVSGNTFRTITNALPFNLKPSCEPDALARPQPAHRLDFPTTGLLLVGKTASALIDLNEQFQEKSIYKTYHAIAIGRTPKEGTLNTMVDGKDAHCHYQTKDVVASSRFGALSLVELKPSTGRRHQLRIQLAELGHPILGDQTYGREGFILKGKGLYLHASQLLFFDDLLNKPIAIRQPLPIKFRKIFDQLSQSIDPYLVDET